MKGQGSRGGVIVNQDSKLHIKEIKSKSINIKMNSSFLGVEVFPACMVASEIKAKTGILSFTNLIRMTSSRNTTKRQSLEEDNAAITVDFPTLAIGTGCKALEAR